MAHLDPSRTALELDDEELAAAGALLLMPDAKVLEKPEAREILERLEAAGISANRELQGYAARIVAVLAQPQLRVMVERFAAESVQRDFASVRGEFGVWGEPTKNGNEFTPIEPSLIAWAVSRAVGLGPRVEPGLSEPIELRSSVFQNVINHLAEVDVNAADAVLEAEGLDTDIRKAVVQLVLDRRLSWRVFSAWRNGMGAEEASAVAVIDGGESGLWFSERLDIESSDPRIRLRPAKSSDVWERIVEVALWPRGEEDDRAT
ncbi:MAG: ESX secretion-associated protein EspG [Gaiellaceae bacterium]